MTTKKKLKVVREIEENKTRYKITSIFSGGRYVDCLEDIAKLRLTESKLENNAIPQYDNKDGVAHVEEKNI